MRRWASLSLACCAAALAASTLASPPPASSHEGRTVVFTGKVVDETGKAAGGASVYAVLYDAPRGPREVNREPTVARTTSAGDGGFRVRATARDAGGSAILTAVRDGHGPGGRLVAPGTNTTGLVLALARESFVAGRVLDGDGRPIAGAAVRVEGAQLPGGETAPLPPETIRPTAVTDAQGRFRLAPLPVGYTISLMAEHPRFARWYSGPDLESGTADVTIRMAPASTLVGRVVYEDGRPAANVSVVCYEERHWYGTTTNGSGAFRFSSLGRAACAVSAVLEDTFPGFTTEPEGVVVRQGEEVRCPDLRLVRVRRGGWVTGRVTDGRKQPISGVGILAMRKIFVVKAARGLTDGPMIRTAADGTYRLRLPPGTWRLVPQYLPAGYVGDWSLDNYPSIPVEADRTVRAELTLDRAAALRGRVLDADGRPAVGASVRRMGGAWGGSEQLCDTTGRFRCGSLQPTKPVELTLFSRDGSEGALVEAVPARVRGELVVRLRRLPVLTGTVKDTGGLPVAGAWVKADRMMPMGGEPGLRWPQVVAKATTDTRGRFSLGLFPGSQYRVSAGTSGYGTIDRFPVRLPRGPGKPAPPAPLRFRLARADGFISGVVVDPDGKPIGGAHVMAFRSGATHASVGFWETTADPDGRFRLRRLPPGDYSLGADLPGYQGDFRQSVAVGVARLRLLMSPLEEPGSPELIGVGTRAPEISVARWVNGDGPSSLSALRGKRVVLQFSGAYNRAARASNEALRTLHARLQEAGRTDVAILAIYDASASAAEVAAYAREEGLPFPIGLVEPGRSLGLDSAAFRAYGVRRLPAVFVIDRDGIVRAVDPMPGEVARLVN
jgi:protocatechuate 3,4-dioxygenase beta subunit/peroxiredoxin